jgi:hypothetical protein
MLRSCAASTVRSGAPVRCQIQGRRTRAAGIRMIFGNERSTYRCPSAPCSARASSRDLANTR